MVTQLNNVKPLNYDRELAELRLTENALFVEALFAPTDEMVEEFKRIWLRREELLREMEMNITPLPCGLSVETAKSVKTVIDMKPCSLEEFRAIPKPGNWTFTRDIFRTGFWWCRGVSGQHTLLPVSVINKYCLSLRQVLILEGVIEIEKQSVSSVEPAHEVHCSNSIDQGYEKYFYHRSW